MFVTQDYDNQIEEKIERFVFNDKLLRSHFIVAGKFGASTLGYTKAMHGGSTHHRAKSHSN